MYHSTKTNMMATVDDDEVKLSEVHKHPFGIISLYIQVVIGMVIAAGLSYFLLPSAVENTDDAFFLANLFAAVAVLMAFGIISVATFVYKQNRLIMTDRNITQVLQGGLFSRKTSQLNLYNVEDVTASEDGFLSTVLGYGTLTIETAGEQANFKFTYCPNPGYYAKIILDARERLLGQMKKEAVRDKKQTVQGMGKKILDQSATDSSQDTLLHSR